MSESNYRLRLVVRTYTGVLLLLTLVFVALHAGLNFYNYQVKELPWLLLQLFHLDEENNIPTWFSSFLLLNNALVLHLYAGSVVAQNKVYWRIMAAGFCLLAVDEVAGLHETFNSSVEIIWAIPGAVLVLIVGAVFVPFLLSLRRGLAVLFIISGILYVSGAILVELLSQDLDSDSLSYVIAVAAEEGLEMLGALLFLTAMLNEMKEKGVVAADVGIG